MIANSCQQLEGCVDEAAEGLWSIDYEQKTSPNTSGSADAETNPLSVSARINELNTKLQKDLEALQTKQVRLEKETHKLELSTFRPARRKWAARITTGLAFACWMTLLGGAVWVWRADAKDDNPIRFKFVMKLIAMAVTGVMWVLWDRWAAAEAKLAEFRAGYDDQIQRTQQPALLMNKIQEYTLLVKPNEDSDNESDAAATYEINPDEAARLIGEILTIYQNLPPRFKKRFPLHDKLLAILIYMLPEGNELRINYEDLHHAGQNAQPNLHLASSPHAEVFDDNVSGNAGSYVVDDDDGIKMQRFEASMRPMHVVLPFCSPETDIRYMDKSDSDADREERYQRFQARFGLRLDATYCRGVESRRCGVIREDTTRQHSLIHDGEAMIPIPP